MYSVSSNVVKFIYRSCWSHIVLYLHTFNALVVGEFSFLFHSLNRLGSSFSESIVRIITIFILFQFVGFPRRKRLAKAYILICKRPYFYNFFFILKRTFFVLIFKIGKLYIHLNLSFHMLCINIQSM